jgi:hypothetical protein
VVLFFLEFYLSQFFFYPLSITADSGQGCPKSVSAETVETCRDLKPNMLPNNISKYVHPYNIFFNASAWLETSKEITLALARWVQLDLALNIT